MNIESEIQRVLADLESEMGITILYACESGSRAWGFASPDSDYDVRFIYVHKPEWYLSIEDRDETIDRMLDHDLDVGGWDVRKALKLFHQNNGALLEWIRSPLVYMENREVMTRWRDIIPDVFNPRSLGAHYYGMTMKCTKSVDKSPTAKRYLYALRAALCARWTFNKRALPPVPFSDLTTGSDLNPEVSGAIGNLLELKSGTNEKEPLEKIGILDDFLGEQLEALETELQASERQLSGKDSVDALLRYIVGL